METVEKTKQGLPPRIIPSLQAGFNDTANHIYLILFPALLDMVLWLGPRVRINSLLESFFKNWIATASQVGAIELQSYLSSNQAVVNSLFQQFNILGIINTFPIGIPSLMSTSAADQVPYGQALTMELSSLPITVAVLVGLILTGIILGSLYFSATSQVSIIERQNHSFGVVINQVIQSFALTAVLLIILIAISIPALIVLTVLVMVLPGMAQIGSLIMIFILLWLVLPMVFSAHGIFISNQSAISTLLTSIRMVRFYLPGTGTFIVISLMLYQGLNVLWRIPPGGSWMTFIGILGHSFIASSLLSASFAYYQGGLKWMFERKSNGQEKGILRL